ncbi:MAG: hypothetical protein ACNA8P_12580, partial [Phycisphaerales bacterium]
MPTTLLSALALTIASGGTAPAQTDLVPELVPDLAAALEAERQARLDHVLCYPSDLTPEERQRILDRYGALPPTLLVDPAELRFFTDSTVWTGDLSQGPSGQAAPARFTYSFASDGTIWGLAAISDPSGLTIVCNTGDDCVFHGLHISPDLDTITYTLGGLIDTAKGWGVKGDS